LNSKQFRKRFRSSYDIDRSRFGQFIAGNMFCDELYVLTYCFRKFSAYLGSLSDYRGITVVLDIIKRTYATTIMSALHRLPWYTNSHEFIRRLCDQ